MENFNGGASFKVTGINFPSSIATTTIPTTMMAISTAVPIPDSTAAVPVGIIVEDWVFAVLGASLAVIAVCVVLIVFLLRRKSKSSGSKPLLQAYP